MDDVWNLVVGASRGIGKAVAIEVARRNPDTKTLAVARNFSDETVEEFANLSIVPCEFDMTEIRNVNSLINLLKNKTIRHLIYVTASMGPNFESSTPEDFDKILSLNAKSAYFLITGLKNNFSSNSRILLFISKGCRSYLFDAPLFCIGKAALLMISQVLKKDLGIPVGVVL